MKIEETVKNMSKGEWKHESSIIDGERIENSAGNSICEFGNSPFNTYTDKANAAAIVLAHNETFGRNLNPAIYHQLVSELEPLFDDLTDVLMKSPAVKRLGRLTHLLTLAKLPEHE